MVSVVTVVMMKITLEICFNNGGDYGDLLVIGDGLSDNYMGQGNKAGGIFVFFHGLFFFFLGGGITKNVGWNV